MGYRAPESCGVAYVVVELHPDSKGNLSKAIRYMQDQDRHFFWPDSPWWSHPPDNPRGFVARSLSYHGLTGRLSVVLCPDDVSTAPEPIWTGFTPKKGKAVQEK